MVLAMTRSLVHEVTDDMRISLKQQQSRIASPPAMALHVSTDSGASSHRPVCKIAADQLL